MKKTTKKLSLSTQTVAVLEPSALTQIAGGASLALTCSCLVPTLRCSISATK